MKLRGAYIRSHDYTEEVLKQGIKSFEEQGIKYIEKGHKKLPALPDFIGGLGGIIFAIGYTIRFFAPLGTREVNMDEVNAHATDALSKVPQDKLPQAMADSAAFLADHFKDKGLKFGTAYTKLADDLYRYHNIAMPSADGGIGTIAKEASPDAAKSDPAAMPPLPATYQDRASARTGAAMGLNA
jgi:hypothetical protein